MKLLIIIIYILLVSEGVEAAGWPVSCWTDEFTVYEWSAINLEECSGILEDSNAYINGFQLAEFGTNEIFYLVLSGALMMAFANGLNTGALME